MTHAQVPHRSRPVYALLAAAVIAAGLATRAGLGWMPAFIAEYGGDTLWALMVFVGLGFLFPRKPVVHLAAAAWTFSILIEISQLYHAPWINAVRATRLGGLVLGFGFLWVDLLCYSLGVGLGFVLEYLWFNRSEKSGPPGPAQSVS